MGAVYHIFGEHECACGSCHHGPLLNEEADDYLSKSDKRREAFREVVLEKKLLKSLPHYVRSTHTGCLESFNGKLLKYTPKQNAFEYDCFVARMRLAALNHNYHLFHPFTFTKDGHMVHHRKVSKRTGTYSVCSVKVQKTYSYAEKLMRAISVLWRNRTLPGDTPAVLPRNHAKLTSPTVANGNLKPRTKILIKNKVSRKWY